MSRLSSAMESFYIGDDVEAVFEFFKEFNEHVPELIKKLLIAFSYQVDECCSGKCGVIHDGNDNECKLFMKCESNKLLNVFKNVRDNHYNKCDSNDKHCEYCTELINEIYSLKCYL